MGIAWSKSGQIEFDNNGVRADGCIANFFVGGTTTPLVVYQDAAETTPHATDVEADANGRWPVVFIPFTMSYDVKVTSGGTQLYYHTEIPNPDPVEAAEDTIDENATFLTGMWSFDTVGGTKTGWVRANGRTIGNAASGATERANADTEDLFTKYWNNHADAILPVSGGRGASAAADYAANKTIALPDARSAYIVGVDDMGNSAAGLGFGGTFVRGNATTGASVGGTNTHTLVTAETPAHTHSFSATSSTDGSHDHGGVTGLAGDHTHTGTVAGSISTTMSVLTLRTRSFQEGTGGGRPVVIGGSQGTGDDTTAYTSSTISSTPSLSVSGTSASGNHNHSIPSAGSHSHTVSGTSDSTGGGGAHNNMPRSVHGTFYIKL